MYDNVCISSLRSRRLGMTKTSPLLREIKSKKYIHVSKLFSGFSHVLLRQESNASQNYIIHPNLYTKALRFLDDEDEQSVHSQHCDHQGMQILPCMMLQVLVAPLRTRMLSRRSSYCRFMGHEMDANVESRRIEGIS